MPDLISSHFSRSRLRLRGEHFRPDRVQTNYQRRYLHLPRWAAVCSAQEKRGYRHLVLQMCQLPKSQVRSRISTAFLVTFILFLSIRCHSRIKIDEKQKISNLICNHNHVDLPESLAEGVDVTDTIEISNTGRGGQCVYLDSQRFIKCSEKNAISYYRCTHYKNKCRARISIRNDKAYFNNEHNHCWKWINCPTEYFAPMFYFQSFVQFLTSH